MNIIDTHSHIYAEEFDDDIALVIERARNKGINRILMPNVDPASIERLHHTADLFPETCLPMMGLHPTEVGSDWQEVLMQMKSLFIKRNYWGVGEIGMDLYWDKTFAEEQKAAFKEQLGWAKEMKLPVSIHARDAHRETMDCISETYDSQLRGVMHSFGGSIDELREIMSVPNLMIGINGVVTFKNSGLREVLKHGDLTRLVIETDAPYLTPAPFRGKRNEPAYCTLIVEKLAEVFETSPEEVARITNENAKRMFAL